MRRRMAAFLVAMLSFGVATPELTQAGVRMDVRQIEPNSYEEGIVLVKYVDEAPQIEDVTLLEEYSFPEYTIGRYQSERYTTKEMISAFDRKAQVIYSEPDYDYEILPFREDIGNDEQSDMEEASEDLGGIDTSKMFVDYAWNQIVTAIEDVETVIAVIDTGVDSMHSDLVEHMWRNNTTLPGEHGYDVINDDIEPMDDDGHGTQSAAMIVAEINNQLENAGITPKIMALKCMDENGTGQTSTAVKAYQYIIEAKNQGVNVVAISNTWGLNNPSKALEDIIREAGEKGIISVCAMDTTPLSSEVSESYPASYDSPYVVVATPMVAAEAAILTQLFPKEEATKIRARIVGSGDKFVSAQPNSLDGRIHIQKAINNPYAVISRLEHTKGQLTLHGYFFGADEGTVAINGDSAQVIDWGDTAITVSYHDDFDGYAKITLSRGDDLTDTEQILWLSNEKYQWKDEVSLPMELSNLKATSYGNSIYVMGGTNADGSVSTKVFCYDTVTEEWKEKANLPDTQNVNLFSHGIRIASVGDSILLYAFDPQINKVLFYQYSIAEDTWSEMTFTETPEPRINTTLVNYQGSIYMVGGTSDDEDQTELSKGLWKLSEDLTAWEKVATLKEMRYDPIVAEVNKKLVITGGNTIEGDYHTTTEIYDGGVSVGADLPYKGLNSENAAYGGDGVLFIMTDGVSFDSPGLDYDVTTNAWTVNNYRRGYGKITDFASTVVNGELYVIGGLLDDRATSKVQSLSFVPDPTPTIVPVQVKEQNNTMTTENDNESKGTLWTFILIAAIVVAILILLVLVFSRKYRKK